jgi:hypothetical protein
MPEDDLEQQPEFTEHDVIDAIEGFRWFGQEHKQLADDYADGKVSDWRDARVDETFRASNIPQLQRMADFVQESREAEEEAARLRAEEKAKTADEALRAEERAKIEQERKEAAEAERRLRIREEILATEARQAAGREGPDPSALAEFEHAELVRELDDQNLTPERRAEIWAATEQLEDAMATSAPSIPDMSDEEFERRLIERRARRG